MQLLAPNLAPKIELADTNGSLVHIGTGNRMLLSFFRDTHCPFCNFRIFQLTQHYKEFSEAGLDIVIFFYSSQEDVENFVRIRPRPFRVVADPDNIAYQAYGIHKSFTGKMTGVFTRLGMWIQGMIILGLGGTLRGLGGLNTNNIMPADFLIDERGFISEVYYGTDAGDHISFEKIERFAGILPKK